MNIDRYMVNLFFEIKRNIPINQQAGMKISNPDIGHVMLALYKETSDENIKLLTRIFLERAGDSWLRAADKSAPSLSKVMTNASKQDKTQQNKAAPIQTTKPKRIYRGQVVED